MLRSCIFQLLSGSMTTSCEESFSPRELPVFFPTVFLAGRTPVDIKKKVISRNETGELGRKPRKNNNSYLNVVFQNFDVRLLENLAELLMDKRKDKLLAGFLTHPPVQRPTLGNVQPQFVQSTESQQGQTIYYDTNKKLSREEKKCKKKIIKHI